MVRKDPHSAGTEADIEAQTKVVAELRRDLNAAVGLLNRIELDRGQLDMLARTVTDADVRKAGAALAQKLVDLEMQLIDLRITGAQDGIRFGAKLVSRFGYLAMGCRTPTSVRRTSTWRCSACSAGGCVNARPITTRLPPARWRRSTSCSVRATSRTSWLGAEPAAWRQSMNLRISSTGRRSWSPPGGAAGTPTATSAASCSGASTPSRPSRASRAMSGPLSQHDP